MGKEKKKTLQPWEAKLIGRRNRFENTLSYWIKNNIKDGPIQENAEILSDMLFDYLNKGVLNVDVKQYEVFGKKIDRPWSKGTGAFYSSLEILLGSDAVKNKVKEAIDYSGFDPDKPRYYSGAQVAVEIFVPTLMQKGRRSSCHFEDHYMARFYNETGIMLDEAAIISDMMEVTCSIADGNYNDRQWRRDVMPFILRGSYQKNLKGIFEQIREEASLNPGITQEMINDRMDKAHHYLGKIYEDFSLTIANTTDFLDVPLKLTDDGETLKLSGNLKTPLTESEQKILKDTKQQTLITRKELASMKAPYLGKGKKLKANECVQHFYRCLSGAVGPENQRDENYAPKPLEGSSALNLRAFLGCAAALRMHSDIVSGAKKDSKNYQELQVHNDLMIKDVKRAFGLSSTDVEKILDPENKISDFAGIFNLSDEAIYGYEKVSKDKIPPLTPPEERENSYINIVNNLLPTKESIANAFYTSKDILYKSGQMVYEAGAAVVNSAIDTVKEVNSFSFDDLELDLDDADLGLGQAPEERIADFKAQQEHKDAEEEARLQKLEADRLERERNKELAEKEIARIKAEEDKVRQELAQKNKVLDTLAPWQQKIIGHKDRYKNTWLNSMVVSVGKTYAESIENGVDCVADYFGNFLSPEVKSYTVYGKKLNKAWGKFGNISGDILKQAVVSNKFKDIFKNKLKSVLLSPGSVQYTSGEQVAFECFAPSYLQGEMRPPIHFNEAYLAEFYNAVGIRPDESSMIGEMMNETLKIKDNNYTDEQWREMIMPAIIQGSFKSQLQAVVNTIQDEYLGNPAISRELYEQRLEKVTDALGRIYEDFSQTLANNTEYLGAPMSLFGRERPELTDEQKKHMSPEQLKKYNSQTFKSISSREDVKKILDQAKAVNKNAKDMGGLFEQFIKNSSGYVIPGEGKLFDRPLAYNDPNRTPEHDKAFIASIITGREIINNAGKRGFFSKLFNKEAAIHEDLMCQSVRETLQNNFGLDENLVNSLLDPKTNIMTSLRVLGLSDESILGYKKIDVPDPAEMANKQKNISDMVMDWAPKIWDYSHKAIDLAKGVVSGGYKLVKAGSQLAVKGVNELYNYYYGDHDSDIELVDEEPDPEDLAEQAKKIEQAAEQEAHEKEGEIVPKKEEPLQVAEKAGVIVTQPEDDEIFEDAIEDPDEEERTEGQAALENNEADGVDVIEKDGEIYYSAEEFGIDQEEPEKQEEQPAQEKVKEADKQPEEEELTEDELKQIDKDAEKDLDDLVGDIKEEQQSMFSVSYWTSGWFTSAKTPEQMIEEIDNTQTQIGLNIKNIDWNDKPAVISELGKLQYTESVKWYLESKRWTVKQGEAALTQENLESRGKLFAETPLFSNLCNSLLKTCSSSEELSEIPQLAGKLNKLTMTKYKELNKAKHIEQKKNEKIKEESDPALEIL